MRPFSFVLFVAVGFFASLAHAGTIDFYEGGSATKNKVGTINDSPSRSYNLTFEDTPVKNNEAASMKLNSVKAGTVIKLFDDAKGQEDKNDYCIIEVLKDVQEYTIDTFEKTYADDTVKVTYSKNNGLDGKVSNIRIDRP